MKNFFKTVGISASIGLLTYFITKEIQTASNNFIIDTKHIYLNNLDTSDEGFTIAHLSDIHNQFFFKSDEDYAFDIQKQYRSHLSEALSKRSINAIVISGDLFDKRRPHIGKGLEFLKELTQIAPVYVVSGNHDKSAVATKDTLLELTKDALDDIGVHQIDDRLIKLTSSIVLAGIEDPLFIDDETWKDTLASLAQRAKSTASTTLLLSHRPERFELYAKYGFDLTFCGHAHGGQIQAPLIGALYAPHQNYFPKYTDGVYTLSHANNKNTSLMHLSRGLGSTNIECRFLSQAHASILILHKNHSATQ